MKIVSAEFVTSAASPTQYPRQRLAEVAFAGRSNVGKSSLINTLLHRKNLVKTSATPGKTRTLNFFVVNGRFSFVDFPGYGYAKVPREMQASWRPMVEAYMKHRDLLRAVVHIVDFRHAPSELDWQLRTWLLHKRVAVLTVATKTDKVKRKPARRPRARHPPRPRAAGRRAADAVFVSQPRGPPAAVAAADAVAGAGGTCLKTPPRRNTNPSGNRPRGCGTGRSAAYRRPQSVSSGMIETMGTGFDTLGCGCQRCRQMAGLRKRVRNSSGTNHLNQRLHVDVAMTPCATNLSGA